MASNSSPPHSRTPATTTAAEANPQFPGIHYALAAASRSRSLEQSRGNTPIEPPTERPNWAARMDDRTTPSPEGPRDRLPNLFEVLSRRTLAPVDLFFFYIYMRDVQRSVDYLDFWLDVSQHMSLCRHYVRELRRSVLISTPDLEKGGASKRSSQILEQFERGRDSGEQGPSGTANGGKESGRLSSDQRLSAFLRDDPIRPSESKHSPHRSSGSQHAPSTGGEGRTPPAEQPPRPSFMTGGSTGASNSSPNTGGGSGAGGTGLHSENSPNHTVARADIRASAEKILYTFLLPGSEREIILPQGILNEITNAIEKEGRDDPEVFDAAKDYVFQAMERDAFPGFLRAKALGNIVPPSMMLRLIIGLVSLFAGFWTAFVLIFLDKSRGTRCWVILPFTIGIYFLGSHQYMLDPILALVGFSEYSFMQFARIREPFVRKLLNKRSLMCLMWIAIIDVAICCLFIFVPGKRL